MKVSSAAPESAGASSGSVIRQVARERDAPRLAAASSSDPSDRASPARVKR